MTPTSRARLVGLALVVAIFGTGALSACADGPARTTEVVIPAGTQARVDAGEDVVVMPAKLRLRVGDTLLIRNEDSVDQTVGAYFVKAGKELRLAFGVPGTFESYCAFSKGNRYEIVVEA